MITNFVARIVVLLSAFVALIGGVANGAVITEFTAGTASASALFVGQSLTTPAGGPWNQLSFNFLSDTLGGTTPSGAGTLFLLTSSYAGTPAGLSSLTPGFLAQSQSLAGGIYSFAPSVTLQPSTPYFFYTDSSILVSGSNSDAFPGGNAFLSSGSGVSYSAFGGDANFRLSGAVAVPEPGTLLLLSLGLAAVCLKRHRSRVI
jgi:hypothetical protein